MLWDARSPNFSSCQSTVSTSETVCSYPLYFHRTLVKCITTLYYREESKIHSYSELLDGKGSLFSFQACCLSGMLLIIILRENELVIGAFRVFDAGSENLSILR